MFCLNAERKTKWSDLRVFLFWLGKSSFPHTLWPPVPPGSEGGHGRFDEWRSLHWAVQSAQFIYETSVRTQALFWFIIKTKRAVNSTFTAKVEPLYPIFCRCFFPAVPFQAPDGRHLVHLQPDVRITEEDPPLFYVICRDFPEYECAAIWILTLVHRKNVDTITLVTLSVSHWDSFNQRKVS